MNQWFSIKHFDTATNSFNESPNSGDVAEGLTTALDNDLDGQGVKMVLTLKMILVQLRKVIIVYSEKRMKPIITSSAQNAGFLNVEAGCIASRLRCGQLSVNLWQGKTLFSRP